MKPFKTIYIIKVILVVGLFTLAMSFENAIGSRLNAFIIGLILYILASVLRLYFKDNRVIVLLTFGIEVFTLVFFEHKTKYVVNYSFHLLYLFTAVESSFFLNIPSTILVGIITFMASLSKYIYLITFSPNYSNLTEMFFSEVAILLTIVLVILFKYYKMEKKKSDQLNQQMSIKNKKLEIYNNQVRELSILEERSRMARDLHDTLGHQLTTLIMQMEMLDHFIKEDREKVTYLIKESKETARDALKELRLVVKTLRQNMDAVDFMASLEELVNKFKQRTGVELELQVDRNKIYLPPTTKGALYHVIQEALTNGIKHGLATKFVINISIKNAILQFSISNNGKTCNSICMGNGLKGMKERIEIVHGKIDYDSIDGFTVYGHIPLDSI